MKKIIKNQSTLKMHLHFLILTIITFLSSCQKNNLPDNYENNVKQINLVYQIFNEANELTSKIPAEIDENLNGPEKKVLELIEKGIKESHKIDNDFLTYLHVDYKDVFRNKLVKSNELFYNSIKILHSDNLISKMQQLQSNVLILEYNDFMKLNYKEINQKLSYKNRNSIEDKFRNITSINVSKLSYSRMFFRLIISSFASILIFSIIYVIILIPTAPISLNSEKFGKTLTLILCAPSLLTAYIFQIYFWILWAAYCVRTVEIFISNPAVEYEWIYYITSFLFLSTPLAMLTKSEIESRKNEDEINYIKRGTTYLRLISFICFFTFLYNTSLINFIYLNEILNWLL